MKFLSILLLGLLLNSSIDPPDKKVNHDLIIFEGSDWCSNCRQLNDKILSNPSFESYIENMNISLIKVDFPQRKKQTEEIVKENSRLAEKFGFDGNFPMIVIANKSDNSYRTLSYNNKLTQKELEAQISIFISNLDK